MAHFAQLDENNVVIRVIVVNNSELMDNDVESETNGIAFCQSLFPKTNWKQTSYNGNKRKNYAGIGYTYDAQRDAFIPPKPYQSWLLDEETCKWIPPFPYPEDENKYKWDEDSISWILLEE